jgi:hypothetical protein
MIADFEAGCVLGDDRLWRFRSHIIWPIFVGSDRPASISIDPQRLIGRLESPPRGVLAVRVSESWIGRCGKAKGGFRVAASDGKRWIAAGQVGGRKS